jgi:hypothetical protein
MPGNSVSQTLSAGQPGSFGKTLQRVTFVPLLAGKGGCTCARAPAPRRSVCKPTESLMMVDHSQLLAKRWSRSFYHGPSQRILCSMVILSLRYQPDRSLARIWLGTAGFHIYMADILHSVGKGRDSKARASITERSLRRIQIWSSRPCPAFRLTCLI